MSTAHDIRFHKRVATFSRIGIYVLLYALPFVVIRDNTMRSIISLLVQFSYSPVLSWFSTRQAVPRSFSMNSICKSRANDVERRTASSSPVLLWASRVSLLPSSPAPALACRPRRRSRLP